MKTKELIHPLEILAQSDIEISIIKVGLEDTYLRVVVSYGCNYIVPDKKEYYLLK